MDVKHTKPNRKLIPILFLDDEPVLVPVLRHGSSSRSALENPWQSSDPRALVEGARSCSCDLALLPSVIVHFLVRVKRVLFSH